MKGNEARIQTTTWRRLETVMLTGRTSYEGDISYASCFLLTSNKRKWIWAEVPVWKDLGVWRLIRTPESESDRERDEDVRDRCR